MQITEVHITPAKDNSNSKPDVVNRILAYVSMTFDRQFCVRNVKIVKTEKGIILSMPSRKLFDGTCKDVAHPVNGEFRKYIETAVFSMWESAQKRDETIPCVQQNELTTKFE